MNDLQALLLRFASAFASLEARFPPHAVRSTRPRFTGSVAGSQLSERRLCGQDSDAMVLAEREEVLAVARGQHIDSRLDRADQDCIVRRIAADRLGRAREPGLRGCHVGEQIADCSCALLVEAELDGQHPFQFGEDELGQHELDATVDRFLEQAAGRPVGDQRRDEHVGVAEDADGSASFGAKLVDERLRVLGADPALLRSPPPVAL